MATWPISLPAVFPPKLLPQFIVLKPVKNLPKTTTDMVPASSGNFILPKCIGLFFQLVHFRTPMYCFALLVLIPFMDVFHPSRIFSEYNHFFLLPCAVSWNSPPSHLKQSGSFNFILIFYLLQEAFLDHPSQKL